jgi:hypothetical protein
MTKKLTTSQLTFAFFSVLLFLVSLTQPAFYIDRADNPAAWSESWLLVLLGWTSLLGGWFVNFLIWLANPFYILSTIFLFSGSKISFTFGLLACVLAFSFSQLDTILASESGHHEEIKSLELGYYLWFSSFVVLTIVSGVSNYSDKRHSKQTTDGQ